MTAGQRDSNETQPKEDSLPQFGRQFSSESGCDELEEDRESSHRPPSLPSRPPCLHLVHPATGMSAVTEVNDEDATSPNTPDQEDGGAESVENSLKVYLSPPQSPITSYNYIIS